MSQFFGVYYPVVVVLVDISDMLRTSRSVAGTLINMLHITRGFHHVLHGVVDGGAAGDLLQVLHVEAEVGAGDPGRPGIRLVGSAGSHRTCRRASGR